VFKEKVTWESGLMLWLELGTENQELVSNAISLTRFEAKIQLHDGRGLLCSPLFIVHLCAFNSFLYMDF
jgi:hypothetical protein